MTPPTPSATDVMTVAAARRLADRAVCFVGIGLPSVAANLARLTHAPNVCLIYESGTIGAKPTVLPLSIGDGDLATTADTVVSTAEIFRYWLQGGRVDVGFLGAAQIDRYANINTTLIGGTYARPQTRLPGAGGAPEIAALAGEVVIVLRQNLSTFVERLDFITTAGFLNGRDARARARLSGRGPTAVITDLCILEPHPETREMEVTSMHPGVRRETVIEATGWPIRFAAHVATTQPPSAVELDTLHELLRRTAEVHGAGVRQ